MRAYLSIAVYSVHCKLYTVYCVHMYSVHSKLIEVLNLRPAVKKAMILLLYLTYILKGLKRRSGTFGSISDLNVGSGQ